MSSRVLKRKDRLELAAKEPSSDEEEVQIKPKTNAFALLNDSKSESEVEEEVEKVVKVPEPVVNKLKKKKNKKKKEKVIDSDEELDRILEEARKNDLKNLNQSKKPIQSTIDLEEDDFDFEEELDLEPTPISHSDSNYVYFTTKRMNQSMHLLNLKSIKHLDPDDELKSLFGNLSLESIDDANSTTSLPIQPEVLQQYKKLARLTRGWSGKDRRSIPGTTRKLLLTKIRDDWLPTIIKPMKMEEINEEELFSYFDYRNDILEIEELQLKCNRLLKQGIKFFKFNKIIDISNKIANTKFYASVVMTPDPDTLMSMIQEFPYHTETLLQVAMVLLRQGGDKSVSYALIEKCLFTFDKSFHKIFYELLQFGEISKIRLPYENFMSRQFHLCIFRNIIALGERSTYFTAFSYCKLLLSLNPTEDPLGVRYFIDHYAIMSEEYKFLIDFTQSTLCTTYTRWLTPGLAYSTVLAYLKLNKVEKAKEALIKAFEYHPYTGFKLFELIGLGLAPIKESELPQHTEIKIASETYLVRAPGIWKDSGSRQFLHNNLLEIMKLKKSNTTLGQRIKSIFGISDTSIGDGSSLPFNLLRFAILSGENKIMAKIPEEIFSRDDVLEYDVLPPVSNTLEYNVHRGTDGGSAIVDRLIDYLDQNLLGNIIQQRTSDSHFTDVLRQLQQEDHHEGELA